MPSQTASRESELILPSNQQAEIAILGGCLVEPAAVVDAVESLKPSDFYLSSHQRIYSAILKLHYSLTPIDLVTVSEELKKCRELDSIGGVSYLASLSEGLPRRLSIQSYVRIVQDKARQRDLIKMTEAIGSAAFADEDEAPVLISQAKAWLAEIEDESKADAPLESIGAYILREQPDPREMFTVTPKSKGVMGPWPGFNEMTCGFQPGELTVVAARPSMGKSAWACNLMDDIAVTQGKTMAAFANESPRKGTLARMYCARARVSLQEFRKGEVRAADQRYILEAREQIATSPLFLSDQMGLTVTRIRSQVLRLHRHQKVDLVLIDQLSGISRVDVAGKGIDLRVQVGMQAWALKMLARELECPVIVMNQLSRGSTQRKDSRPALSDLAESGFIEQHADMVVLLHRPEYYDKEDLSLKGKAEMIIAKQREGPTGTIHMTYNGQLCAWKDDGQEQINY